MSSAKPTIVRAPAPGKLVNGKYRELPPERSFLSLNRLETSLTCWARRQNYATSIGKAVNIDESLTYTLKGSDVVLEVFAKPAALTEGWDLVHEHTVGAAPEPEDFKLRWKELEMIKQLDKAGLAPADIVAVISVAHTHKDSHRTIRNQLKGVQRNRCKPGMSSVLAGLLSELEQPDLWLRKDMDENGWSVRGLLFGSHTSLAQFRDSSQILLLDQSFNADRLGMQMVTFAGVNKEEKKFCGAFGFIDNQSKDSYVWLLQSLRSAFKAANIPLPTITLCDDTLGCMEAVETVFPDTQLRLWFDHVNKLVAQRCKPAITTSKRDLSQVDDSDLTEGELQWKLFETDWHLTLFSSTKDEYLERYAGLKKRNKKKHPKLFAYVKKTWLEPFKRLLVNAWVVRDPQEGVNVSEMGSVGPIISEHVHNYALSNIYETARALIRLLEFQTQQLGLDCLVWEDGRYSVMSETKRKLEPIDMDQPAPPLKKQKTPKSPTSQLPRRVSSRRAPKNVEEEAAPNNVGQGMEQVQEEDQEEDQEEGEEEEEENVEVEMEGENEEGEGDEPGSESESESEPEPETPRQVVASRPIARSKE